MTRINLICPEELSDQHLIAEFRELPRIVNAVVNGKANLQNIPEFYVLGKNHVKFFYNKILFLAERYAQIYAEMKYRGFKINDLYSPEQMFQRVLSCDDYVECFHVFSEKEIDLSRMRIIEKIQRKPDWYKWTKRKRPEYLSAFPSPSPY
jgi:deoxyribonuclease (pyrimidine dimer)